MPATRRIAAALILLAGLLVAAPATANAEGGPRFTVMRNCTMC